MTTRHGPAWPGDGRLHGGCRARGFTGKVLLAASGLALAAGPASAAEMLSVGVGGYMQQWFGMVDVDDEADAMKEGGVAQQSDSEIFFKGKLDADNGMTFSVKVELEGNSQSGSMIDESQVTVGGEFGQITLGAEDSAVVLTHMGVRDAGFGMLCGDMGRWINGINECGPSGLGTAGHGLGDRNLVSYFTPRVNGAQMAVSYIPNTGQEGRGGNVKNNDMDAWSVAGNYKGDFGNMNLAFSAGHYQKSQMDDDDYTFTNAGLQVGMGAFSFDVAYATADDGMKTDSSDDVEVVAAGVMYSEGALAVSLSGTMTEADDGTEQSGGLFSASYMLAPGIAWRSSLFMAERDRGTMPGKHDFGVPSAQRGKPAPSTGSNAAGSNVEGAGFVTGITLSF